MSKRDSIVSVERLRELFTYHPDGYLVRRISVIGKRFPVGQIVLGTFDKDGYRAIGIDKTTLRAHRVIWAVVHGTWPNGEIDHINRVKADNRIENLRESTRSENAQNGVMRRHNTSGYKGVWKVKHANSWCAEISINGNPTKLGYFKSPEEASEVYLAAARAWHTRNPAVKDD